MIYQLHLFKKNNEICLRYKNVKKVDEDWKRKSELYSSSDEIKFLYHTLDKLKFRNICTTVNSKNKIKFQIFVNEDYIIILKHKLNMKSDLKLDEVNNNIISQVENDKLEVTLSTKKRDTLWQYLD